MKDVRCHAPKFEQLNIKLGLNPNQYSIIQILGVKQNLNVLVGLSKFPCSKDYKGLKKN